MTDSKSKCNELGNCRPVLHEVECALGQEELGWCSPAQSFPWPGVEQPRDVIQLFLGKHGQVGSLGQILAKQAVGVFHDAPLPGSMRMGEVNIDPGIGCESLVVSHLHSLVVGHGATHLTFETVEDFGEGLGGLIGRAAVQLHQGDKQRSALDQGTYLRLVALADNQVAFPSGREPDASGPPRGVSR